MDGIITGICIVLPSRLNVGTAVFLLFSIQGSFAGSRVKNPDSYLLDIQRMNGTDIHALELRKVDVLHIQVATEKGSRRCGPALWIPSQNPASGAEIHAPASPETATAPGPHLFPHPAVR